jgi:hypothetical protein
MIDLPDDRQAALRVWRGFRGGRYVASKASDGQTATAMTQSQ